MTTAESPRRPPGASLLILALVILAIGAIPAGIGLAFDPSGGNLGFSVDQLAGLNLPSKTGDTVNSQATKSMSHG